MKKNEYITIVDQLISIEADLSAGCIKYDHRSINRISLNKLTITFKSLGT